MHENVSRVLLRLPANRDTRHSGASIFATSHDASDPRRVAVAKRRQDHFALHMLDLTNPTAADQQHARQYGAEYIPRLIRFDASGKETARTNYLPAPQLIQLKDGE